MFADVPFYRCDVTFITVLTDLKNIPYVAREYEKFNNFMILDGEFASREFIVNCKGCEAIKARDMFRENTKTQIFLKEGDEDFDDMVNYAGGKIVVYIDEKKYYNKEELISLMRKLVKEDIGIVFDDNGVKLIQNLSGKGRNELLCLTAPTSLTEQRLLIEDLTDV